MMKRVRGGKRPAIKCAGTNNQILSSPSSFGKTISGCYKDFWKRNDLRGQKMSAYQGLDIDDPG
jgi:hypothetical protein